MNILMLSLDKKIFQKNSAVQRRMIKYGQLCHKLFIIVLAKKGFQEMQLAENVWVYPTNSLNKIFYIFDAYRIGKSILKEWARSKLKDNSAIITSQDPFETALVGYWLKKRFQISLNIQIHGDFFSNRYFRKESLLNFFRFYLGRYLLKKADTIRVVSQRIKSHLVEKYKIPESRIVLVPIYTDVQKIISQEPKFDLHQFYPDYFPIILTIGRLVKVKNIELQIKSLREVVKKYPMALLFIIGAGPEKDKLKSLVRKLNLQRNIIFKNPQKDLLSYYKTADFFVLSSNYEGYGLVVVEAAAAGLPIIMTDVGCAGEVIKDGQNGLIVPVGDKNKLIEAIFKMIENPEMRQRFRQRALETVKNLPSEEEILELYKKSWMLDICS